MHRLFVALRPPREIRMALLDLMEGVPGARWSAQAIRLVVLLNDVSMRRFVIPEMQMGFGFINAKPATTFAPVAVTPDELGDAWRDGRIRLDLRPQRITLDVTTNVAGRNLVLERTTLAADLGERARHVTAAEAWPGFRIDTLEAARWSRIGDLCRTLRNDGAHIVQRRNLFGPEIGSEDVRRDFGQFGRERTPLLFPAVESTIEDEHLAGTHDTEDPSRAGCRKQAGTVIDNDGVGFGDAHRTRKTGKILGRRQTMRKLRAGLNRAVVVEENRSGNVTGIASGPRIAVLRRQLPCAVHDFHTRFPQVLLQPISADEGGIVAHCVLLSGRHLAETNAEAAVFAPLLLNLADVYLADLARSNNMRSAAGLAVDRGVVTDAHEPNPSRTGWRTNVLRFNETRIGRQLLLGYPAGENRIVGLDHGHQPGRGLFLAVFALRKIGIDTGVFLRYCRAGDRERIDDGQKVAGGVHLHQPVAARPIDGETQRLADRRELHIRCRDMDDLILGFSGHRRGNLDLRSVRPTKFAGIARLPTGSRIEDGAIQDNAASLVDGDDTRLVLLAVGVFAEHRFRLPGHYHTSSKGTSMVLF